MGVYVVFFWVVGDKGVYLCVVVFSVVWELVGVEVGDVGVCFVEDVVEFNFGVLVGGLGFFYCDVEDVVVDFE